MTSVLGPVLFFSDIFVSIDAVTMLYPINLKMLGSPRQLALWERAPCLFYRQTPW